MPNSSGGPSKLHVPGAPGPAESRTLYVTQNGRTVARTVTVGPRAPDPGFFKRAIEQIKRYDGPITLGLSMSNAGKVGWMIRGAVLVNVGNPWLFSDRRDAWKEIHGHMKGNAWDIWYAYFDHISPNWKGRAVDTLQQYLRFKLIGMFDQLGNLSKEMSGTMQNQYNEVAQYDAAAVGLWTIEGPVFKALTKLAATPAGRIALMAQSTVFLTMSCTLLTQFYDVYRKFEGELNGLDLKFMDLKGAFYLSGDPARGPRDLHMDQRVTDSDYWSAVTKDNQ
ncbi:hypothetical protein [Nonomuraea sp. LPB2021202275-12-8]|uniref:hypothetical protein n=1 Tax=Nonomuraea sp. LPB2021202275-12-8 TaxID=3120159 RepID=UPI00300C8C2D